MADLAKSGETPNGVDDVVGSFSLRLVNDERAVERSGLWFAGHAADNQRPASCGRRLVACDWRLVTSGQEFAFKNLKWKRTEGLAW